MYECNNSIEYYLSRFGVRINVVLFLLQYDENPNGWIIFDRSHNSASHETQRLSEQQ